MNEPAAPRPRPVRRAPLVAPGHAPVDAAAPEASRSVGRGIRIGLAIGLSAGGAVAGLVYAIAAIPLFLLAQISPDGRDRPEFRTALVVALVIGGVLGLLSGAGAGVWAARGGRLPTDRTPSPFLDEEPS